jgi:CRISPR/Cas system endoribonuclease Cas6 (RAMP superfamily)
MGSITHYYTKALQRFAYSLMYSEDKELATELQTETSDKILEYFILMKKKTMPEKGFYFLAGSVDAAIFNEATAEGGDASNASCGGLNMFREFIEIDI